MLGSGESDIVLPGLRGKRTAVLAVLAAMLFVAGGATALFLGSSDWSAHRSDIDLEAFTNGLGVYVFSDGKYDLLVWKKKIIATPGSAPEANDIAEASRDARAVGPDVRFFTYGLDVAAWPVVPPYSMAFCIVRDETTIDGIYPIRLKPINRTQEPIYELLLPTVIDNLKSGAMPYLFWVLNYQYSCNDGWTFKFARSK